MYQIMRSVWNKFHMAEVLNRWQMAACAADMATAELDHLWKLHTSLNTFQQCDLWREWCHAAYVCVHMSVLGDTMTQRFQLLFTSHVIIHVSRMLISEASATSLQSVQSYALVCTDSWGKTGFLWSCGPDHIVLVLVYYLLKKRWCRVWHWKWMRVCQ